MVTHEGEMAVLSSVEDLQTLHSSLDSRGVREADLRCKLDDHIASGIKAANGAEAAAAQVVRSCRRLHRLLLVVHN